MKPLHGYLIKCNKRYNNATSVDGNELILNTELSNNDARYVNREGIVVEVPTLYDTPIQVGDTVLVHHNVFRRWEDVRGNERNSGNWLTDDLYIVYPDQVYAYKNTEWNAMPGYALVSPLNLNDDWSLEIEKMNEYSLEISEPSVPCPVGSVIGTRPDNEYEFTIDGKKMYRVLSRDICIDYGYKERTAKDS